MADPIKVVNSAAQLAGKELLTAEDEQVVSGPKSFARAPAAPFLVEEGSGSVAHLDADLLDGEHGADFHNASLLGTGTLPSARFPDTLPAVSGENLTNLDASDLTGVLPATAFPATLPAVSGENLTNLDASDLASGTIPDARFPATLPAVSGANLTNLDASDLASGTIPDARFPATLPAVSGENLTAVSLASHASCAVTRTAAQTIADNTYTDVSFDAENHDPAAMHSTATNPDRITVPADGVYLLQACVFWAAHATGGRRLLISLNTPSTPAPAAQLASSELLPAIGGFLTQFASVVRHLSAGDIIRVSVFQNSGGNLDVLSPATYGAKACWASVTRLA